MRVKKIKQMHLFIQNIEMSTSFEMKRNFDGQLIIHFENFENYFCMLC